ncbi:coagulation factor IXa [Pholidichthys leucotaenia]
MAAVSLSLLSLLILDFHLCSGGVIITKTPDPSVGQVFLSDQTANRVLQRRRRENNGLFEEVLEGNMERECIEEVCDLEEAREIFENDEKTMEFWMGYADGNQCRPNPCLNQSSCKDKLGYYTCSCVAGFTGRNCEIVIEKRCDVNNGDCMHFCESMGTFGAKCSCATGYKLMQDGVTCEPEDEFPCGRTALKEVSGVVKRSLFRYENVSLQNTTSLPDATPNSSTVTSPPSTSASTMQPNSSGDNQDQWKYKVTTIPSEEQPEPYIRIVGGGVVRPGEIPWQVALIARQGNHLFCGGSILNEHWVITAAHCLREVHGSFFVRVGEYNIHITEGTEQDYDVLEQHLHPRYNASVSLHNHDIALLYLKEAINFSATVRPICIGPKTFTESLIKASSPATISGWGRTRFLGATSVTLKKVEVPYTDRTECKRSSSTKITPVMFCAGYYDEAKDACQGDSGGPHANSIHETWFLTGIISWGEECAKQGKYGVYTRLSLYYRWINHVIGLTKERLSKDFEDDDPEIE